MIKLVTLLLFLLASKSCLSADSSPLFFEKFNAIYTLTREGTTVGEIQRSITEENGHYVFRSRTRTTGLVSLFFKNDVDEETQFKIIDTKITPLHYKYFRNKNDKLRDIKIKFDWEQQKIITHANDSKWTMPMVDDVYDKLLYEIVIMQQLNQGLPITQFNVADGGKIKVYSFETIDEETLSTPAGDFETIVLERKKSNEKSSVSIWYAVNKNYLPVKVQNTDKEGKTYTATIKRIERLP